MMAQTLAIPLLSWNMPPVIDYMPGTPIGIQATIYNENPSSRFYRIDLQLTRAGTVLHQETLTVDGETEFLVNGQSSLTVSGEVTLDVTDAALELLLWDYTAEEYVGAVATELRRQWTWGEVAAAMGLLVFIAVLVPATIGLFRGEKKHE